ncbi:Nucleotidyl transferase AbiEii toxin, Type IV TA system [bacterium A37T11]|nr:Nucleotidyl transferase AbiEii toxin, Type IV TA system [bacterium A37T11]
MSNLPDYFEKIIALGRFHRWEGDNDRKQVPDAPIAHYKFYYQGKVGSRPYEEPVLLDILFSENPYPNLISYPIKHEWLHTADAFTYVSIPSIESIAGDKLTAFAPNTTGILHEKNRPGEIIKQLFDVAYLFDEAKNVEILKQSYMQVVQNEIKYRGLAITWRECLEDSFTTAWLITRRDMQEPHFQALQRGIQNVTNMVLATFRIDEAIICAAKLAYLTKIMSLPRLLTSWYLIHYIQKSTN